MKPQNKHLTFASQEAFNNWLNATTHRTITFEDDGQDLLKIWIAKTGEILHANLQAGIWKGRFVHLKSLHIGKPLRLWDIDHWQPFSRLIIERIESSNHES